MSAGVSLASLAQIKAATPERSTWLSANAGSGKTRVLTNRVARLLLNRVDPQNILCLTYTKAAASEMQNRLFAQLGEWAMKPDGRLQKDLLDLGVAQSFDSAFLSRARRLFAQAVETPGGLRIQTIHSFCASLLRRFPREAGVPIGFKELDDRSAAQLRERVADDISQGDFRSVFLDMASLLGGHGFEEFTAELVSKKAHFQAPLSIAEAKAVVGLPAALDEQALCESIFLGGEKELLQKLSSLLQSGSKRDATLGAKLGGLQSLGISTLPLLESVFLYTATAKAAYCAKTGAFPTKASLGLVPELYSILPQLDALMLRVEDARPKRIALVAARAAHTLNSFGRIFLERYENIKASRGLLDFDDQILLARKLLTDPALAQWVLYRLDGGIDHILVDEAQDTSPEQWAVIEQLAQEITSGQGLSDDRARTVFVVGDKKQSIYSFQGADATEFDRMRATFEKKLENHEKPLLSQSLAFSFRSSKAILSLVDEVFKARSESGFDPEEAHQAFHDTMPGRVDIWDPILPSEKQEEKAWYDPVDILGASDPVIVLANDIAQRIRSMIDSGMVIPEKHENGVWKTRPLHEGDFLVLLQRRNKLFHEIIRACKRAGLEIAGADRLKINSELAVKDVKALLRFLATPEDDLSLACALKSPLFGWSEQDLFALAATRSKRYLWQVLREAEDRHPKTISVIGDLLKSADFLRPYELIERILTNHEGRQRLKARLGHEAEDAIDAFVAQALAYEQSSVPSLTGFLSWLESDDPEVKRQVESAGQRIRVMTVHGSKGLEAPIVIMPETQNRNPPRQGVIVPIGDTAFLDSTADERPPVIKDAVLKKQTAQMQERERLLYVAMTRAEKWLIVAAAGATDEGKSWYHEISKAADTLGAVKTEEFGKTFRRIETGEWQDSIGKQAQSNDPNPAPLEPMFKAKAQTPPIPEKPVSASQLAGAKSLGGPGALESDDAMRYGSKVHLLLETLPEHPAESWPSISEALLEPLGSEEENARAIAEAKDVIRAPHLQHLFSNKALSEVPFSAPSSILNNRIHGIIDKLIIDDHRITIVDFKTNAKVPRTVSDCPSGILAQMGAYVDALEQIYQGRDICAEIVWTRTGELMQLPHDLVIEAYKATTYLDAISA